MHALEKILARASGKNRVKAGEIVNCKVDLAEVNDLYLQVIESFEEMGGKKVWDPEKVVFVFDHYAPAPTIKSAANHKVMREFVWKHGIKHLFDINAGVCHQVMPEAGLVFPGMILVATDSHTTTHGAFGAFGTGVGATDLACILISGELWFRVPEVIKIEINGTLLPGVLPKDVILHILGRLGTDVAVYKAIEFTGETVEKFDIAGRMVVCNMAVEMGAKTSYIQPDEKTLTYLKSRGVDIDKIEILQTDPDYEYSAIYTFDVSELQPQVAIPHSVDNVVPVDAVKGTKVDQVFIGSCTGGRLEDIEWAYKILKGKTINDRTRLVIIPASRNVFLEAIKRGYVEVLVESGATFSTPGCGPCLGAHQGVIADGEVCVTATNRNFPGRMGSTDAQIYLTSPATAAACALAGKIVDPREYMEEV
ncbi:3-isopropylmalate dehydratase large subunit [Calderihabitans maritimus]|uniref:3-isopropylmalate dehydratase large subunit n=1 Tax=Calderihabitans maritimus TaxID=1246530 RepID=A0A1Z5HRA7_9FIRM|nr:3-isopropylmalate dehydratase large subunit [Calderihabitans maritimus]GAW91897.1 3-isopropylmalate dehydratase [Calderihabitans maritimus]